MTFILIMSSVTMVLAVHAGHYGDKKNVAKMAVVDDHWRYMLPKLPGMGMDAPA